MGFLTVGMLHSDAVRCGMQYSGKCEKTQVLLHYSANEPCLPVQSYSL
jgi:hypothetical protein